MKDNSNFKNCVKHFPSSFCERLSMKDFTPKILLSTDQLDPEYIFTHTHLSKKHKHTRTRTHNEYHFTCVSVRLRFDARSLRSCPTT